MAEGRVKLTREGHQKLTRELQELSTKKRRQIAEDLARARAFGDLRENAEYDAAKNAQAFNEARIAELSDRLSRAEIIDESQIDKSKILIGAIVTLRDLDNDEELQYTLVSSEEADFKQNRISVDSPIGKGLLGYQVGSEVTIKVPVGALRYKVLKIER